MKTLVLMLSLLLFQTLAEAQSPAAPKSVVIIFDASVSMLDKIEDQPKLAILKEAFRELAGKFEDPSLRMGLVVYGHRRYNDCEDIERLVPSAPAQKEKLIEAVEPLFARGMTPIAAAIEIAVGDLAQEGGQNDVVLLTDGIDTCERDPVATVRELKSQADFRLHVVGFGVLEEQDAAALRALAEAGGGGYFTAASVDGLFAAISTAAENIDKVTLPESVPKVLQNIHIVLDRSNKMGESYEGTTRLAMARRVLSGILDRQVADRDNLAYRSFGGPCRADNTEFRVPFGLNNGGRIRAQVEGLSGRGKRTLVAAVTEAAYDFERLVPHQDVDKRVVIITGGVDVCGRLKPIESMRQKLENRNIRPEFEFIGIGIPRSDYEELQRMAKMVGGRVRPVRTEQELEEVLTRLFEIEPIIRQVISIQESLNSTASAINEMQKSLNEGDLDLAEKQILEAERHASQSLMPYQDLARRKTNPRFQEAFALAKSMREFQRQGIDVAKTLLKQRPGYDAYIASHRQYDELRTRHNKGANRRKELLEAINSPE